MLQPVIFATNGIFPQTVGGIQRHSRLLIEEMAGSLPVHIYVIHPHAEKVFDERYTNITEINIEPIDFKRTYLFEIYRYSKRMYSAINQLPPNIPIYCQGFCLFYKLRSIGHRVIYNPHGLEQFQAVPRKEYWKLAPFRIYADVILQHCARVVSLGGKLTEILRKRVFKAQKIVIIPNAVNLPQESPILKFNNQKLQCLFVSRFASNKGIHILMQAIRELNEEGFEDKLQFNLGGKGPLFEHYSENFQFANVNFLGFVPDEKLFSLYQENDVFVFPTLFEGMPTVVLEAMSYSMPVIVSDVGATAELVGRDNGYLIEKNSVDSLKKAIISFYQLNETQKREMAANSYNIVKQRYTWPVVARMTYDVICGL